MTSLITINDEDVKYETQDGNHFWYKGQQFLSLTKYKEAQEKNLEIIKLQEEEIKKCKEKIAVLTSYIELLGEENER